MIKRILFIVALACSAVAGPLVTTSCTAISPSTQTRVYKTLAGIGETVDVTVTQAAQAHHLGQISESQWQEIAKVHGDYLVAYATAVDAGAVSSAPAPDKLIALSARISALLASYLPTPN